MNNTNVGTCYSIINHEKDSVFSTIKHKFGVISRAFEKGKYQNKRTNRIRNGKLVSLLQLNNTGIRNKKNAKNELPFNMKFNLETFQVDIISSKR